MKHLLVFGDMGTPLFILPTSEFDSWKTQQSSFIKTWLQSTQGPVDVQVLPKRVFMEEK